METFAGRSRRARIGWLVLCLTLLAPLGASAETTYRAQTIAQLLEYAGDTQIVLDGWFEVGTLTDPGHLVFSALSLADASGNYLLRYAGGKIQPIAAPRGEAPGGPWPADIDVFDPVSMNQQGQVVFAARATDFGRVVEGIFRWDEWSNKVMPVATPGMPAIESRLIEPGNRFPPVVNDLGEIAFGAWVKDSSGRARPAILFRDVDGKLHPVALPDQALPDGTKIDVTILPSLNEAGAVAFLARRPGEQAFSAYLWPGIRDTTGGALAPVAVVGMEVEGGGTLSAVTGVWVNDKNQKALVQGRLQGATGDGLYWSEGSKLTPIVAPGQTMPDGSKLQTVLFENNTPGGPWVSAANQSGQHAFIARLEGNTTAAYLLDAEGMLSLILKSGATTNLGPITDVGHANTFPASRGIGLNAGGQVALSARIDGAAAVVLLLTPVAPETPQ